MWTRRELKTKGKAAFLANYWKTVLIALILAFIVGGAGAGAASGNSARLVFHNSGNTVNHVTTGGSSGVNVQWIDEEDAEILQELTDDLHDDFGIDIDPATGNAAGAVAGVAVLGAIAAFIGFFVLIIAAVGILLKAFLLNPLQGGISRFFVRNLNTKAEIRELAYCYDHGYLNTVKTLFLKELFTFLWSLLFIIPGIIKAYQYRMIPYILAEHPEMPCSEVFEKSKQMMQGQKWNAFVLDLSFIGWEILSLLTLGILGIFYVDPYRCMTNAALYEALEYGNAGSNVNSSAISISDNIANVELSENNG